MAFARILKNCDLALQINLTRRIRHADRIDRGEELRAALEPAEQFPARITPRMDLPVFGRSAKGT